MSVKNTGAAGQKFFLIETLGGPKVFFIDTEKFFLAERYCTMRFLSPHDGGQVRTPKSAPPPGVSEGNHDRNLDFRLKCEFRRRKLRVKCTPGVDIHAKSSDLSKHTTAAP